MINAAPARNAQLKKFKVVIKKAVLTININELIGDAAHLLNAINEQGKSAIEPLSVLN